ncbi:MAG: hypothetical protein HY905_25085 [Deltaproteobacteria bacterium]|nr:hypothetical protein [Deltaproteobacteria bacterium]
MADRIPQRSVAPYPVHLALRGRKVLLVGAGKIAARRIDRFLRAGARVVVVAPKVAPAIARLVARGRVELRQRAFVPADVRGAWLVHAATDDPKVNRAVLAAVRAIRPRGIPALASAADASWPEGDFVIPASFEHDGMIVSVSSRFPDDDRQIGERAGGLAGGQAGGQARAPDGGRADARDGGQADGATRAARSRDVKNLLARQLAAVSRAKLLIVGAERERLGARAFAAVRRAVGTGKRLAAVLLALRPVDEFLVVVAPDYCAAWMIAGAEPVVVEVVRRAMGLDAVSERRCTILRGRAARAHAARILASTAVAKVRGAGLGPGRKLLRNTAWRRTTLRNYH